MADQFKTEPFVKLEATIRLTEPEIRVLYLLSQYSTDAVIAALSEKVTGQCGSTIMAHGISTLLETADRDFRKIIRQVDAARAAFRECK